MSTLPAPGLSHVCDLRVELNPIIEMGRGRGGARRIVPIIGGTMKGPRLNGRILHLGADWQTVFEDGLAELDTRYSLETDDGAVIDLINYGLRHGPPEVMARVAAGEEVDPGTYYMRTQARMETGDERYGWVNRTLFVGTGARKASHVLMSFYAIL